MSEPITSVVLSLQVGEDWDQVLTFFDDPAPVPDPPVDPMVLNAPVMAIRQTGYSVLLASFDTIGDVEGTLIVGGDDGNQLTITLPALNTYDFQGMGKLSFDIFDVIDSKRVAIVKSGLILVTDATTPYTLT
jgi:hypothetical protein